jgi:hypothetical protein
MRTDTNMAWPDDPYGTGQLWRREPLLISGFSICWMAHGQQTWPVSYAVTYLLLHRTHVVDLTSGVSFGFRAVAIEATAELKNLLHLFDLDAMRARRLAKIVAGWRLGNELDTMQGLAATETYRGIQSLAESWLNRRKTSRALAQMCDVADDQIESTIDLATAATRKEIDVSGFNQACTMPNNLHMSMFPKTMEWLTARSTANALICALIAGHILDRFTWDGLLDIGATLTANAGDCFGFLNSMNESQSASTPRQQS